MHVTRVLLMFVFDVGVCWRYCRIDCMLLFVMSCGIVLRDACVRVAGTEVMKRRTGVCVTLEEKLFCLGIMGDERAVKET